MTKLVGGYEIAFVTMPHDMTRQGLGYGPMKDERKKWDAKDVILQDL